MDYKELWKRYKEEGDEESKNALIINYVPLVKNIAGRYYISLNSNVDYDDLVGDGILGLIDAVDKFDYKKNIKFETYASIRIRGAIVDQVRSNDWIPRSLRSKYRQYEELYDRLQHEYDGEVPDRVMAEALEMTLDEYHKHLGDITTYAVVSLEEKLEASNSFDIPSHDDASSPDKSLEKRQMKESLVRAMNNLSERDRRIMELYYYSELTYKEIAEIIGVTESRISQIHTKSIVKLRAELTAF